MAITPVRRVRLLLVLLASAITLVAVILKADLVARMRQSMLDAEVDANAQSMVAQGRDIFRHDTFGSETFWGDKIGAAYAKAGPQALWASLSASKYAA